MNTICLLGRLVRDPETRYTQSGKAVTNFTLAVDRQFDRDKTDFINCTAWGKTAELVGQYVRKSDLLGVTGELNIDKHEDKYYTKVNVNKITFISGKKRDTEEADNDVPFVGNEEIAF